MRDASVIAVMIPRGTAAAVLASIPLQLGLEGGELIQSLVYSVVVISILLTALLLLLLERGYGGFAERLVFRGYPANEQAAVREPTPTVGDGGRSTT